jgi:hypothetical protein
VLMPVGHVRPRRLAPGVELLASGPPVSSPWPRR